MNNSKTITEGGTELTLLQGDITKLQSEAIVNAANSSLLGGGGVDGAIHRAGGPAILEDCRKIRNARGSLDTGKAVITTGGNLPARYVIHTVGPVYRGGTHGEPELLKNCYHNSLQLGAENNIRTIAFPSISTGIFGYPITEASKIAFTTCLNFVKKGEYVYEKIYFVVFSAPDYQTYAALFQ